MITISILTLHNAVLSSITDTSYLFVKVNEFLKNSGKDPLFRIQLVGLETGEAVQNGQFTLRPQATIAEMEHTDLIIIPSMAGDAVGSTYPNREFASWIAGQYKKGAEVASLCTGAFLLAFTGLLRSKECTTHWAYANEFRYYYPDVNLVDEKMITHQNGLYSSGGGSAYWSLLLYLVEKYTSREIAILAAKFFVIDLDRRDQSPFIIFLGRKNHEDMTILRAQEYIEQNYTERLTVGTIADKLALTRRTFERRFKKATRNTVAEYIQRVKIEAAKKQLEIGRKSTCEVMEGVGYSDMKTFRDLFRRFAGMTPNEYRGKYNRE